MTIRPRYAGLWTTLDAIFYDQGTTHGASAGIHLQWTGIEFAVHIQNGGFSEKGK